MRYRTIGLALVLSATFLTGCKKDSTRQLCQELQHGMTTNNFNEVNTAITLFIVKLPSNNYSRENLNALAAYLSGQCSISAQVLCFDCIQTLPPQSEIRLSFTSPGTQTSRTIDISHAPGDTKIKMLNMHE